MTLADPRGLWVKVDGVTRTDDVAAAADAGVSAVGMIFAPSSRIVTMDVAEKLRAAVPSDVLAFGVFDGSSAHEVATACAALELDGVQFPAELVVRDYLDEAILVLRTVRVREAADLAEVHRLKCAAVHIDAFVEGALGGTGRLAPWDLIAANRPECDYVVSGGLRTDNVAEAVRLLQPMGVDVSSGVESEPGVKDHAAMRAFVDAARSVAP